MFYKAIVQSMLLYGSETWDAAFKVIKALSSFHHRMARQLSGRIPCYL
jgi:DNA-binding transcriptional regulator/RsmH inhibitor MraZ